MQIESAVYVQQIALELLKPHALNQKIYGDPVGSIGFEQLVQSIRLHGVLEPLLIDSDRIILSGHRRAAAACAAGLTKVPIRVLDGLSVSEQYELIIALNQHRQRPTSVLVREALAVVPSSEPGDRSDHQRFAHFATSTGMSNKRLFVQAQKVVQSEDETLIALMDQKTITAAYRKLHRSHGEAAAYSSLIKPSDNWNFSPVKYPRINNNSAAGYIPGDIYANCFWYFVKPGDYVVDAMAGSGMARHVYEHRQEWMGKHPYDFHLALFDLSPQASDIKQHNLLSHFPAPKADYIFLDLPYLGMAKHAYSRHEEDLANMDEWSYRTAIQHIAHNCASVQRPNQLCTVISPNYTDHRHHTIINMAHYIRTCWISSGYRLYLETYASRRIQQTQNPTIARLNTMAKQKRLPLTDIVVIMTFQRNEENA